MSNNYDLVTFPWNINKRHIPRALPNVLRLKGARFLRIRRIKKDSLLAFKADLRLFYWCSGTLYPADKLPGSSLNIHICLGTLYYCTVSGHDN